MLSCSCYDGAASWWYCPPKDFKNLDTIRARRCASCKILIRVGVSCLEFTRGRYAKDNIECLIYGEDVEIAMPNWYLCERCGEIYLNLKAIGYCILLGADMNELLKEYWEITGFKPREEEGK